MSDAALFKHDLARPFLWYSVGPTHHMDPGAGPGMFIDLDFVE